MDKKDELGDGYSLDDFGLSFDDKNASISSDSADKINALDLEKLRESHSQTDLRESIANKNSDLADSHNYAPQFQGFDFSKVAYDDLEHSESSVSVESNANPRVFSANEKDAILQPLDKRLSKQSEIVALFVAYAILFFVLLLFMPQVYLANNIYYASKNINYLKSQREALRDENGDLQQKLESLKFNFLTLEIEEIK